MPATDRAEVAYRGYLIFPTPKQLREMGEWTLEIQICRDRGSTINAQLFTAANTFETRDRAVAAGVQFGQRIIDGEVPNLSVAEL